MLPIELERTLERTMYSFFRSVYLLSALTCEGSLCLDADQIADLKCVGDIHALMEAKGTAKGLRPWALVPPLVPPTI